MSEELRLTIQVAVSLAIIFGVLWWMWRMRGEAVTDSAAAPVLAFASVWFGVAAVGIDIWLWFTRNPDAWVVVEVIAFSATLATSLLSLWIYRYTPAEQMSDEILMQRLQARVGLTLGLLAVLGWYVFVLTNKQVFTPVGV